MRSHRIPKSGDLRRSVGAAWMSRRRDVSGSPEAWSLGLLDPNLLLVIASEEAHAQKMRAAGIQPPYSGPDWPWWFGSVAQVATWPRAARRTKDAT